MNIDRAKCRSWVFKLGIDRRGLIKSGVGSVEVCMELPRGITGFRHVDEPPPAIIDLKVFRSHCHEVARTLGGDVRSVETSIRGIETNFARAYLEWPDKTIMVLLNHHFPVIAFAEPSMEGSAPLQFVDDRLLADVFNGFGIYQLWSRIELEASVTPETCRQLADAELEQLKYWRPRHVGEIVFNFWD